MSADIARDTPVREPDGKKGKKKLTLPPPDPMLKAEVHSRDTDSLELTFEIARAALKTQQEQRVSLENKANMRLVFAGGILALLMNAWNTIIQFPLISQQIILGSVVIFSVSVLLSLIVAWVKRYRVDPNPYSLAQNYLNRPESETKLQLISNWSETWKVNLALIEKNAMLLRLAFGLQVAAFLMLGLAFGLSIFQ